MPSALAGLDALLAKLEILKTGTLKKATKAGVNAGLGVLAKSMRQAINSSPASPQMKRAARLTIGKRLLAKEGKPAVGKAGFAVGKQSKRKKEKAKARAGDKSRGGVGISASNIHWPTLGTKQRTAGQSRDRAGRLERDDSRHGSRSGDHSHRTGAMPAVLAGVIETAVSSSEAAVLDAARTKIQQVIAADAAKRQ